MLGRWFGDEITLHKPSLLYRPLNFLGSGDYVLLPPSILPILGNPEIVLCSLRLGDQGKNHGENLEDCGRRC
jgi:hypothetical protein